MNRTDPEALKKELFDSISELSESSRNKLNLIFGVHCDAGKTVIRRVIAKEIEKVLKAVHEVKEQQENMQRDITDIKDVVGGFNGKE
jgi:DNA anti-recombination protein RmuC